MNYTIFKPNPKNTGALVNFRVSKLKNKKEMWEERLFIEFIPQKNWNQDSKQGSFDTSKKKTVMINPSEAGDLLHTLSSKIPFQTYHQSSSGGTWIKFAPFKGSRKFKDKEGNEEIFNIDRFGFSISEKGFYLGIPVEPSEGECLRILFENYVKGAMGLEASELSKKYKKTEASKNKPQKEESVEEESFNEQEDIDDVPF